MYVNFTFFNYYIRVILIGMWKIKPVEKQSIYVLSTKYENLFENVVQ